MWLNQNFEEHLTGSQLVQLYNTIVHESIHRDQSFLYLVTHPKYHPEVRDEANRRTPEAIPYIKAWYPCRF